MIECAVVLAAGKGSRLGAITAAFPKPLLEVGGRPVIAHTLAGLAAAGVGEAAVVTGHFAALVEAELGDGRAFGLSLTYCRQGKPEGTARAVALARDFLRERPFLFAWGDVLVQPSNFVRLARAAGGADALIAVNETADPSAGAAVYLANDFAVERIVEKPAAGTSTTQWNNAGLGALAPSVWPFIQALEPSVRGEYELPAAIAAMVAAGLTVRALPIEGPWFDIGTPADLRRARAAYPSSTP